MAEPAMNAACDLADHVWIMKKCVADLISSHLVGKLSFEGRLHCMFVIICLIRFEHRSIMWFICFDAWWWRILSMHGRPAGYQCLSISNCWPKFSWAGCTVSAAGWSGWSSLHIGQVLKAAFIACPGVGRYLAWIVIQWSQVSDDLVDHAWTIKHYVIDLLCMVVEAS
jgi:hypothetical protein